MTVKELREILENLPDGIEVEVNSIYDIEKEELIPSPIEEAHYASYYNKVFITPKEVSY